MLSTPGGRGKSVPVRVHRALYKADPFEYNLADGSKESAMARRGLRLTGGAFRGAKLYGVHGNDVRPALGIVRKSLFSILGERVKDARVLDLFAGTGSVGFEALARGAREALFIDQDDRCVAALKKNVEHLRLEGRVKVARMNAFGAIAMCRRFPEPFDLVFVDPPYRYWDGPRTRERLCQVIEQIALDHLSPEGCVVVEHAAGQLVGVEMMALTLLTRRRYGGTELSIWVRKRTKPEERNDGPGVPG